MNKRSTEGAYSRGYATQLARAKLVYHHQRAHWHALTGDEQMLWWEYSYGSLQKEVDDANLQWVDQMTNLSKGAMPLGRKITSVVVALVSVGLAVGPFWSPAAADAPVPLLQ